MGGSTYPTAAQFLVHGNQGSLHIHRSFRSSWLIMLLLAYSIFQVIQLTVSYGDTYRWAAVVPCGLVLVLVYRFVNDLYVISRDRVTHQCGRVSLRYTVPSIRCIDLRAINVNQTIMGRILNYGNVELCTAAQAGAEVTVSDVVAPRELAQFIDDLRVASNAASNAASHEARETPVSASNSGGVGND